MLMAPRVLGINSDDIIEIIEELSKYVSTIKKLTNEIIEERKKVDKIENS